MARPTLALVQALRTTAARLQDGAAYRWSHFAQCNCGNLVQTITTLSPKEIYEAAFQRSGDWGEQAEEFCTTSGYPIDFVIGKMLELGMTREDVRHLERLSDPDVCRRAPRTLRHNRREDVVTYMQVWADLLEEGLAPAERPLPLAAE
ncbi:MAG: hypothetical protein AAGF12_24180 [Myxococcota bacterium]